MQTVSQNMKGIVKVNPIRSEISKSNPFTHISKPDKIESMTNDHNTVRPSNSYNYISVTTGQNNNLKEDNKMCKDISTSKSIKDISTSKSIKDISTSKSIKDISTSKSIKDISCATKVSTPITSINEMRSKHKERMFSEYNISGSNKIENTSCTTDSKHTENLPEPQTETSTVAVSSFSRQSRACKPNFECLKFTTDDIRNVDITKQDKAEDNRNDHTLQHVERKTFVDKAINQKTIADQDQDKYSAQVKRAIQHEQVNSLSSNNKNNIKQKSEKTESDSKEIDPRRINLLTSATVKTSNWLPVESPSLTFAAQTVNKIERNSVKTSTADSNFSVIERKRVTENSDLKQRNVASGYKSKTENTQISTKINLKYKRDKLDSQTTKPAVEGSLTKLKDFRRKSDRHGFEIESNEDQNITEMIIHRQSDSKIYPRTESLAIKSVPDNLPQKKMLQSENASYDDKEVESLYTWDREKNASSNRTCQKLKCINTSKNFTSTVKPTTIAYDVPNNKYGTEQGTSKDIPKDHSTDQIGNNFNKTLFGARKKDCFVEIDTQITIRNEQQHKLIPSDNNGSIGKIESKEIIKEQDFCSIFAIESDENQCFVQSVKDGCEKYMDQKSKTINQGYNMESKDDALLSIEQPIDRLGKEQTKQKDTGSVSEVSCIQSVEVQESKDTEENNSIKTNDKKRRSNSKTLVNEISQSEYATGKHKNVRCDIKSTDLDEATRSKNVQSKQQTSPKVEEEQRKQEPIKNTPRQDRTSVTDTTGTKIHTNLHKDLKCKGEASKATDGKCQGKEKSESKGLPQVLKIRINNTQGDIDVDQFLKQRLNNRYRFRITEVRKKPVFEVLVEFPSRNASRQAKTILCNSNAKFKIKVECSIDIEKRRETQQEAADRRLSAFVGKLADTARVALVKHEDEIQDISSSLEKFTEKRPRFQSLEEFNKTKNEKEALLSKEIEMKKQEAEFKLFLTSLYDKLQNIKDASFCENDLSKLETAFAIEHSRFTTRLPIYASRTDILRTVTENQTSIILGETGSGKSTQVVQYLHQTGRFSNGFIVCTQPRKVAAISLATRVAHEMVSQVGHLVGYHVGMHSKKSTETQILYMTDHILLNECLRDPLLSSFSCVIIDEAHERSIFTDLLLGMIKKCLPNRPDLRVVVTSATIDPEVFVRFFGGCPILSVSGRTFPVDILWSDDDIDDNYEEMALQKAIEVHKKEDKGDILIFLTSPLEVDKCCKKFEEKLHCRKDFICLPLHGKLQAHEQQKVFVPPSHGKRKVVFATNSAETSITIPGIKYVVDTGRIKEMQFDTKKNISSLVVTMVTKSSANQRSGRSGRTSPGKCFRLYTANDYENMNACSTPEILRVNLGQALLKLLELCVDPMSFDFVQSPPKDQMTKAMETLVSIGTVTNGQITDLGRWVAKLPFDPIFGVFVHDALEKDIGIEALILTASCGSGGSMFYRAGSNTDKANADKMKIRFSHEGGDVMTMLNAFREWHKQPEKLKGKWCAQNFVNGKTIKAVRETVTEVLLILKKELGEHTEFKFNDPKKIDLLLQKMLFKTFKHNICHFLGHEKAGYHVINKEHNVCLFPSSSLPSLGLQPEWIVIEQVLQIQRDYGVNATPVPYEWIEEGLSEGWLKPFGMESAKQQRVSQVAFYGVGEQTFRDFVGHRYAQLKDLETTIQTIAGNDIVIIDTDKKYGEIKIYSTPKMSDISKGYIDSIVDPIQMKHHDDQCEQYLSTSKQGTRVIVCSGGHIGDILMPDEYKTVLVSCCDQTYTSSYSKQDIENEFEQYGEVKKVEMFAFTKNKRIWGKVCFATTSEAENAVTLSKNEYLVALPTGNTRQQSENRFRAKLEWCRRPSNGCGFIEFQDRFIVSRILTQRTSITIAGKNALLRQSNKSDTQIFITRLDKFVNEDVLAHSFMTTLNLREMDIKRTTIVRQNVQTTDVDLQIIRRRIQAQINAFVKVGRFHFDMKTPRDKDFNFFAFVSFSNLEEGRAACRHLESDFKINDEIITATLSLQTSLLATRNIFNKCKRFLLNKIDTLNKQEGINIRHKILRNGNCSIDINCDHIETLQRTREKLNKIILGKRMKKEDFPNIKELFTRAGTFEIKNIMAQTDTLIIDDYRVLEVAIYGEARGTNQSFTLISAYLLKLRQGVSKSLNLRGPDKPYGVIKEMFIKYGIDLEKLKRSIKGLHRLQIDLRHHTLEINGSSDAVDNAVIETNSRIIDYLKETQKYVHLENKERQCLICFMEIEDGEIYRLESCGHPYCKTCIIPQLESAVNNNDFPIVCCQENCNELWAWRDLLQVSLLSGMTICNVVNRATISFVARNPDMYKYCITPDCPSIYRVTKKQDVFFCCECEVRVCTACNTQCHEGFSCEIMKELKEDSSDILMWLRRDPKNRKLCPNCGLPMEKAGGCDHMECMRCRKHICWRCMKHFPSSGACYGHLREIHGTFGGGYEF